LCKNHFTLHKNVSHTHTHTHRSHTRTPATHPPPHTHTVTHTHTRRDQRANSRKIGKIRERLLSQSQTAKGKTSNSNSSSSSSKHTTQRSRRPPFLGAPFPFSESSPPPPQHQSIKPLRSDGGKNRQSHGSSKQTTLIPPLLLISFLSNCRADCTRPHAHHSGHVERAELIHDRCGWHYKVFKAVTVRKGLQG